MGPKTPTPSIASIRILSACLVFLAATPAIAADLGAWQQKPGYKSRILEPATQSRPGFTTLPPSTTGIDFTNALTAADILANNNYMNGSGVAAGDFDGDGRIDLYFCSITGTNALYRNRGHWQFERVPSGAHDLAGMHSTGAVFADVNADGLPDLLVATLGQGVQCLRNTAAHRFEIATDISGLTSTNGTTSLALADLDGDGDLDLYAANYGAIPILRSGVRVQVRRVNGEYVLSGPHAQRLQVIDGQLREVGEPDVLYLNDGRGRFTPVPWNSDRFLDTAGKPQPPPYDFGMSVQMRDLNGDGTPDIFVCNDFESSDRLWLNDGTAHFRAAPPRTFRKHSFASMGADAADVDRDGHLDLFVGEMLARDPQRRLQQVFSNPPWIEEPGALDAEPQTTRNTLFRNRGDNTYAELAWFAGVAASDWSWGCAFLDVDFDGFEDLLIGTGMPHDILDRDTLQHIRSLGRIPMEQARTNLLRFPPLRTPHAAFRNLGGVHFAPAEAAWGFDTHRIANGLALADLDDDGDEDIVFNCLQDGPWILRNNADGPRIHIRVVGRPGNPMGIGTQIRVESSGLPTQSQEILAGGRYLGSDAPERSFAVSRDPKASHAVELRWRNGARRRYAPLEPNCAYVFEEPEPPANLRAEAPVRTATVDPAPIHFREFTPALGHKHTEKAFNDWTRQPLLPRALSQLGPGIAWMDLDADGRDELIVGTGAGGPVEAFDYAGTNGFRHRGFDKPWTAPDDTVGFAAWASSSGQARLLIGVAGYETMGPSPPPLQQLAVAPGSHRLAMESLALPGKRLASPGPLAVADADGDGLLDLFVGGRVVPGAYPEAADSHVYLQSPTGWIEDIEASRLLASVGLVSDAVWSDLDADGLPELVLALEWGPIKMLKRRGKGWTEFVPDVSGGGSNQPMSAWTGWWRGINAGDFDGDGRMDLLASNWGWNDAVHASERSPAQLHFTPGTPGETLLLLEAHSTESGAALHPIRAWETLVQAVPSLAGRFPSNRNFAQTPWDQSRELLVPRATKLTATTLASTLFLNRGNSFEARSLPEAAQITPASAVRIADADGDGREDVFMSQNFYPVRPGESRLDAGQGLWLRGDGRGGFEAVDAVRSGLRVDGDQRGAAFADFNEDGRIDLAISQNGAATRVYENTAAKPGIRVRLRGQPSNPWGIGAQIWLRYANGSTGAVRELHAGGGYWSQDSLRTILATPHPPELVEVRWPGGTRTSTPVPVGALVMDIPHP